MSKTQLEALGPDPGEARFPWETLNDFFTNFAKKNEPTIHFTQVEGEIVVKLKVGDKTVARAAGYSKEKAGSGAARNLLCRLHAEVTSCLSSESPSFSRSQGFKVTSWKTEFPS